MEKKKKKNFLKINATYKISDLKLSFSGTFYVKNGNSYIIMLYIHAYICIYQEVIFLRLCIEKNKPHQKLMNNK